MSNEMTIVETPPDVTREKILSLEQAVHGAIETEQVNEIDCPLTHRFAHGVYVRELFVPKGTLVVAKIHKHDHISMLMKGTVLVATEEGGVKLLEAPMMIEAPAGTKRVAYACEDIIWATVHPNPTNSQDLEQIEAEIIAPTYASFDAHIAAVMQRVALDQSRVEHGLSEGDAACPG